MLSYLKFKRGGNPGKYGPTPAAPDRARPSDNSLTEVKNNAAVNPTQLTERPTGWSFEFSSGKGRGVTKPPPNEAPTNSTGGLNYHHLIREGGDKGGDKDTKSCPEQEASYYHPPPSPPRVKDQRGKTMITPPLCLPVTIPSVTLRLPTGCLYRGCSLSLSVTRVLSVWLVPVHHSPERCPTNSTDDALVCRSWPVDQGGGMPRKHPMPSSHPCSACPNCSASFPYRSNRRFCSARCRKDHSQKQIRSTSPMNAHNSPTVRRDQHELFDLAMRMAERLYSLPPFDRLGFLEEIVQQARSGQCPRLRKVLTMPHLLYPDRQRRGLFHRRCPDAYLTIAQVAERYCRMMWGAGVVAVISGETQEPMTGEVDDSAKSATSPQSVRPKAADCPAENLLSAVKKPPLI